VKSLLTFGVMAFLLAVQVAPVVGSTCPSQKKTDLRSCCCEPVSEKAPKTCCLPSGETPSAESGTCSCGIEPGRKADDAAVEATLPISRTDEAGRTVHAAVSRNFQKEDMALRTRLNALERRFASPIHHGSSSDDPLYVRIRSILR